MENTQNRISLYVLDAQCQLSGTKLLAVALLSPVRKLGPPWIGLVCPAHPTDSQLNSDLGNLEAKSTPPTRCCVPQTIPEPFLLCGMVHYPAERGHSQQGIPFSAKGVHGLK